MGVYFDGPFRVVATGNESLKLMLRNHCVMDVDKDVKGVVNLWGWYDDLAIQARLGQSPLLINRGEKRHLYLVLTRRCNRNFTQDQIIMPNNQGTYVEGIGSRIPVDDYYCDVGVFHPCNNSIFCNVKPDGRLQIYICMSGGKVAVQELDNAEELRVCMDEGRYDEFLPHARIDYLWPENFNPGRWTNVTFDFKTIGR